MDKTKTGFTVLELNKGDKIVFQSGEEEIIQKHGYVMFADDWEKFQEKMEKDWNRDKFLEEQYK